MAIFKTIRNALRPHKRMLTSVITKNLNMKQPTVDNEVWTLIKPTFPKDLKGASILDVGSHVGYFSILAKLRDAGRILGESIDFFLEQAPYIQKI